MSPANENRPRQATGAASKSVVATPFQDTGTPRIPHRSECEHLIWDEMPNRVRYGPAEPLDDCPDCHGAVQRYARHSEGLGGPWKLPLTASTIAEPYSPRLPGPGMLSAAMDAYARVVAR